MLHLEDKRTVFLVLSPGFPANEADTTCLPAQQSLIRSINKTYPFVHVIILAFEYPYTTQSYQWFGNEVIPFGGRNKGGIHRLIRWIKIWFRLAQLNKKYRVSGILSFWLGQCALVGKYFARINGLKQFTWILGQDARKGNRYVRLIRPKPEELISLSDFITKEFVRIYAIIPAKVIYIGIEPTLFPEILFNRDIDVLGVGALIPLKQYDIFLEVVKNIKLKIPLLKAVLCGSGKEQSTLQKMIIEAGLEDTVTLTGEMPHPEVLKLMNRSKILLHTSAYEGLGVVCLEALYAGAHVISFCNPKDIWVRNWHIADNQVNMAQLAIEILQTPSLKHKPVLAYSMHDTTKAIMELFNYSESAIS